MATETEGGIRPDFAPPFVWPSSSVLAGVANAGPLPLEQVLAGGSSVFGVVSSIDHRGAEWVKTVLNHHPDLQAMLILAVFAGCSTRSHAVHGLLQFQAKHEGRAEFRMLPMSAAQIGAPAKCIAVAPKAGM